MKIYHIALLAPHEPNQAPQRAMKERGHEVMVMDWVKYKKTYGLESLRLAILNDVRTFNPDIVFMQIQTEGIIDMETVYRGSLNSAVVRIAELLRLPIALQSASMIMMHNHPSGDPTPSPEDVRITELVKESAKQMDIDLLDHLIIGRNRFVSLKERGLGFS